MTKNYKYDRPFNGQPEERIVASWPPAKRLAIAEENASEMRTRRDEWNATHPPERQIPRPVELPA